MNAAALDDPEGPLSVRVVYFDYEAEKSVPLPDDLKEWITALDGLD